MGSASTKPPPIASLPDRRGRLGALVFGALFAAVGTLGSVGSWATYLRDHRILNRGERALAVVTRKEFVRSSDGDSDPMIEFRFETGTGVRIEASRGVSRPLWSSVVPGDRITVAYSREHPRQNVCVADGGAGLGVTLFSHLLGTAFAIAGISLWVGSIRMRA